MAREDKTPCQASNKTCQASNNLCQASNKPCQASSNLCQASKKSCQASNSLYQASNSLCQASKFSSYNLANSNKTLITRTPSSKILQTHQQRQRINNNRRHKRSLPGFSCHLGCYLDPTVSQPICKTKDLGALTAILGKVRKMLSLMTI